MMNLDPRIKKILIIVGFIAVVLLLAWLIYTVFFKPAPPTLPEDITVQPPITGLPTVGEDITGRVVIPEVGVEDLAELPEIVPPADYVREVEAVVASRVSGVQKNDQGELVYYNQDDGKFYRYSAGEIIPMSDKVFYNVDKIAWARSGDRAILEYPDGNNIFYDFKRQKQISLPKEMKDFSFDRTGEKIAAKVVTDFEENNWLIISNYDGSGIIFLEHIGEKDRDVQVDWSPAGEIVATYREGVDFERQEVYPIGQSGGNLKSLLTAGRGFASQWSPQGDFILYNVYNSKSGYRPTLWLSDMGGDWTGSYNINLGLNTWSDKCTFTKGSRVIYCAVPESLPELSGIFRELSDDIGDVIYRINIMTGNKSIVAIPQAEEVVNATNLQLSANEDILYFTDHKTGQLKQIKLR